jgi:hypothetical protein
MRQHADDLLAACAPSKGGSWSWFWVWLVPTGLLAVGALSSASPVVGFAMGLAAAVSLSGSV